MICRINKAAFGILVAWLVLRTGAQTVNAAEIFSEDFSGGLAAWDVIHSHFSTSGGELRGNGDGARGAMFHSAAEVREVRFSFQRTENGSAQNFGDAIEVGITPGEDTSSPYMSISGGSDSVIFQLDARQPQKDGDAGFYIYGNGGATVIGSWNILGQITSGAWYDGLIRLLDNDTVTFGWKPIADSNFTYSAGHALPSGFVGTHVGATAYRVPINNGATGIAVLDNISAFSIPEPGSSLLSAMVLATAWSLRRRQFATLRWLTNCSME